MLRKSSGFTVIAALTLALGLGANTAIFSVADAVLWKPLPLAELDRLAVVMERRQEQQKGWIPVSPANYLDWKAQNTAFDHLAAFEYSSTNLIGASGYPGDPERVQGFRVSPDFFETLGVKPALGRTFLREEEQPGRDPVVVLSHRLWQRRFGADPNILGKNLVLDGRSSSVVGIMPPPFDFPLTAEL